jgi:hypothetical protein
MRGTSHSQHEGRSVISITAVVYQENGLWIAHCLEKSFVSCAQRLEDLPNELLYQIHDQIEADLAAGQEPFSGFEPAPRKYWEMWEAARAVSKPLKPRKSLSVRWRELVESFRIEARLFQVSVAASA